MPVICVDATTNKVRSFYDDKGSIFGCLLAELSEHVDTYSVIHTSLLQL